MLGFFIPLFFSCWVLIYFSFFSVSFLLKRFYFLLDKSPDVVHECVTTTITIRTNKVINAFFLNNYHSLHWEG